MQIGILSCEPSCYSTRRLIAAGEQRGHRVHVFNTLRTYLHITSNELAIHSEGLPLPKLDALIPRIGASVTFYGTTLVRQLQAMGIFSVNDSQAIIRSRDKLHSLQLLAPHVPLPKTGFAHSPEDIQGVIKKIGGYPLIIKLLEGSQGKGVILAETPNTTSSIVDSFHRLRAPFLVQQYIEEAKGCDIRCLVIDGQVVATMKREAQGGEFRANLHRGGKALAVEITPEERDMAIKAAQIMGLQVSGVDILRTPKGSMVLEVNSSPGLRGIEQASGKDIAGKIMEYVERKAKS
jgi:ribosomal protein S6--L-glutamate ligase